MSYRTSTTTSTPVTARNIALPTRSLNDVLSVGIAHHNQANDSNHAVVDGDEEWVYDEDVGIWKHFTQYLKKRFPKKVVEREAKKEAKVLGKAAEEAAIKEIKKQIRKELGG